MDAQLSRVREKLESVRFGLYAATVFGADRHGYRLGPCASPAEIADFEAEHAIRLPEDYAAFLTCIGNGGADAASDGAGPFYGLYRLGKGVQIFGPAANLARPIRIAPETTPEVWRAAKDRIEETEVDDDAFDAAIDALFSGLLPIGFQGCTCYSALALNGPHRGRVVNVDIDEGTPWFAHEATFLDWYERWQDEVLSGKLAQSGQWFGADPRA